MKLRSKLVDSPLNKKLGGAARSVRRNIPLAKEVRVVAREVRNLIKEVGAVRKDTEQLRKDIEQLRSGFGAQCPVCLGTFDEYRRYNKRRRARCPECGAAERHRMSWLYLKRETSLFSKPTRMLHFAPEAFMRQRIEIYMTVEYTPTSYDPEKPDEGDDIQNLPYADQSFDLIYCSHVLEHVPDDRKAMRELHRVLAKDGVAVILVPNKNIKQTYEDPSITSPEEREKHFGQWDHLRWYGRDFPERLIEAGFEVEIIYYSDHFSPREQRKFGIRPEPMFICKRA